LDEVSPHFAEPSQVEPEQGKTQYDEEYALKDGQEQTYNAQCHEQNSGHEPDESKHMPEPYPERPVYTGLSRWVALTCHHAPYTFCTDPSCMALLSKRVLAATVTAAAAATAAATGGGMTPSAAAKTARQL